eukprot:GHRR01024884.1.p1 GENE.GHRR01024884.1~~GHRR01024884.1.p1  ORF type:complete len:956 (+),score=357.62 GHRR01024884.1:92-2959(+)
MVDWESYSFQSVFELLKEKHDRPGAIKRACDAVEDCLISNKDNLRGFFEHCFPLLLKRIFGYDDKEASWLHMVAVGNREEDATALIQLLAPTGPLFAALHVADGDQLIQFLFPPERLPAHTQELLRLPAGRLELDSWPQYHGRLRLDAAGRCQVHLNMFQYFMFWAAFYVLRAGRSSDKKSSNSSTLSRTRSYFPNRGKLWGNNSSDPADGSISYRHPYAKLLRLYMEHYLPRPPGISPLGGKGLGGSAGGAGSSSALGVGGPGLGVGGAFSSLAGGSSIFPGSPSAATPGETLLSVLLEFWLTDAGEPLPSEPQPLASSRAGSPNNQLLPISGAAAAGPGVVAGALNPNSSSGMAAVAAAGLGHPWGMSGGVAGLASVYGAAADVGQQTYLMRGPTAGAVGGVAGLGNLSGYGGLGADRSLGMGAGVLSGGVGGAPGSAGVTGGGNALLPAGTALHTYSYQPPAEDLITGVSALAKYVYVGEPASPDAQPTPAQSGTQWLPQSPVVTIPSPSGRLALSHHASPLMVGPAFSPAVQVVSRKLYRLLRRTFAQWQPSSTASLSPIVKLWLVVLCPWKNASYTDTAALKATIHALSAADMSRSARLTGRQQGNGTNGTAGVLAGAAAGALRSSAGAAAGLGGLLSAAGNGSNGQGGSSSLFGGAGQVAALASGTLNRWGSEVAHHFSPGAGGSQDHEPHQRGSSSSQDFEYTLAWRSHVLAHLPFYTQLLPAFLELAYSQMAYSGRQAIKEVYRVMKALAESGEALMQELAQAEAAYNKYIISSLRRPEGDLAELLPWLADQAADWEQAAAAGAPTTPPIVPGPRYRMFDTDLGGAASCLRAIVAAAERQQSKGAADKVLQLANRVLPMSELPSEAAATPVIHPAGRDVPKAGSWRDVMYHGDWMLRPIASNEIAPLVRLLVCLSQAVNGSLGLQGILQTPGDEPPETMAQVGVVPH